MIEIVLNGEKQQFEEHTSLAGMLEQLGYAGKRVAVEVNMDIVPASQHGSRVLAEGDRVEIVHAIGGG